MLFRYGIEEVDNIDKLRRNCKYCKLLFLKDTLLKYILISFDDHLPPLISITDERFPPAWLQPLPSLRSVQGLQLNAIPAGVVIFHSNQLVCAID
ncbi:hypothetical protein J5S49_18145 [Virgibacillus halodenitrificans]|uniref:hypothetical protein n=1 Tax=Virgibacillus halodenitrificans TaxID=1482 RepID=UPI00098655A1|nr:hypothetical protein [Virgibacillus halodenitrificans]MCG1030209.1 hypothetical protein [Virgibacillus halodenitrificans]